MHREPPPDGADTNTRPYLIFFSYMLTCLLVSVFIFQRIFKTHAALKKSTTANQPPSKHVLLFSVLAVGSLLTTWTFMIKYFNVSYQSWLTWRSYYELDPHHRHWGLWLKETSLFREAWETVIVGNARYWWSHQIFFFALGLGLYLEQRGVRRGIKHTWAFMLLGQIVAISFATNLFLLTLLLSPPAAPPLPASSVPRSRWLGPWPLNLGALFATVVPAYLLADDYYWHHPTDFMPILLTPHVALLVLPFVRVLLPAKYFPDHDVAFNDKVYGYMWALTFANAAVMMLRTTWMAVSHGGYGGIRSALLEHPAVSSVGFDVIFCWVTWICWSWTQGSADSSVARKSISSVEKSDEDSGVCIASKDYAHSGNVRHR